MICCRISVSLLHIDIFKTFEEEYQMYKKDNT